MSLPDILLKSIGIGIAFGIPVGTIGMLALLVSLKQGFVKGLAVGLSSSVSDLFYVTITVFGISCISDFLLAHQEIIKILGSLLIIVIGIRMFFKKNKEELQTKQVDDKSALLNFASTLPIALSNPVAILTFGVAFSTMHLDLSVFPNRCVCCLGVFIGATFWWVLLAGFASRFSSKVSSQLMQKLNIISGIVLFLLGIGMMVFL